MGDVAHIDGDAAHLLYRQVVEFIHQRRTVVQFHIVFELTHLDGTGGDDLVLRRQRILQILGGKIMRLQRRRIEVDLDLALLAAIRRRDRRALHRRKCRADEILAQVVNILLIQRRT